MKRNTEKFECSACSHSFEMALNINNSHVAYSECPECGHKDSHHFAHATWLLTLQNAKELLHQENYRGSIVEALSGWEVFLATAIRYHLQHKIYDKKLLDALLMSIEGLRVAQMAKTYTELTGNKIETNIGPYSKLRNKVVHQGYIPTQAEAEEIVTSIQKTAYRLVDSPFGFNDLILQDEYWGRAQELEQEMMDD